MMGLMGSIMVPKIGYFQGAINDLVFRIMGFRV